jgi:putative ABC transport system permease protein
MLHLRSAARSTVRSPAAFLLSAGTLAIAIGLTSAMLAVLNGTLWHPLPFAPADRLVALAGPVTADTVADWSAASRSYDAVAGYRTRRYTLTGSGDAVSLRATVSTGELFRLLEAKAAAGRLPAAADDRQGARAVVLSDECLRSVFHGDGGAIGRSILLNGAPFVVVGIMPPGFRFPLNAEPSDVYTTVAADRQTDQAAGGDSRPRDLSVVARLKPGVTVERARAEFPALWAAARPDAPARDDRRALVVPLASSLVAPVVSPVTALAWAVVGVVAVACVTTAILSLIRVNRRRAEWATRLAIGATPRDLVRQVLGETVVTALSGGCVGALVALAGVRPLIEMSGSAVAAVARPRFDATVWCATAAAAVVVAIVSGLFPAIHAAATGWSADAGRSTHGSRAASAARDMLVAAEVALAVMLLAGSVSLIRAYATLSAVDVGFKPGGLVLFRVDLPAPEYPAARRAALFERLREAVTDTRGVTGAGYTVLPPFGDLRFTLGLQAPGEPAKGGRTGVEVHLVSPGHFKALGVPLIEGRDFTTSDDVERPPVVVISRALAVRMFAGRDPIGQTLDVRPGPLARGPLPRVVGVVGDIRNGTLVEPQDPQVYLPYGQAPMLASATFLVRLRDDRQPVMGEVRRQLARLDPTIAPVNVRPFDQLVSSATALPRFTSAVSGVFASSAMFLAMSGLYAVVAYSALGRRREFSIRRALGATERRIGGLVFRHTASVVLPGLALGAAGAVVANRLLEHALFGVHPGPAWTILVTIVSAACLAMLAAWWPARAAARDDLRARLQAAE